MSNTYFGHIKCVHTNSRNKSNTYCGYIGWVCSYTTTGDWNLKTVRWFLNFMGMVIWSPYFKGMILPLPNITYTLCMHGWMDGWMDGWTDEHDQKTHTQHRWHQGVRRALHIWCRSEEMRWTFGDLFQHTNMLIIDACAIRALVLNLKAAFRKLRNRVAVMRSLIV